VAVIARQRTARGEIALRTFATDDGATVVELVVDGVSLMSSLNGLSERALATRCLEPMLDRPALSILIAGLGMGFTLEAVLQQPNVAVVHVVEVEPVIVDWARERFAALNGDALSDSRVSVFVDDVTDFIRASRARYDAILMDVDNGPTWLASGANAALYQPPLLGQIRDLLVDGGVLGVWASERSPDFVAAVSEVFGVTAVSEHAMNEVIAGRALEFVLYSARRESEAVTD